MKLAELLASGPKDANIVIHLNDSPIASVPYFEATKKALATDLLDRNIQKWWFETYSVFQTGHGSNTLYINYSDELTATDDREESNA